MDDKRLQLVELWFEFLNLAHHVAKQEVQIARHITSEQIHVALKESASFYADWGDTTKLSFQEWWGTHMWLFIHDVLSIRGPGEKDPDDTGDTIPCPSIKDLLLFIPLNRPKRELLKEVEVKIIEQMEVAKDAKPLARRPMLTHGAQPRPDIVRVRLTVCREVTFRNPTLNGQKLLDHVHAFYRERGEAIPRGLNGDKESSLKCLTRYIEEAERLMLNAAKGDFPGQAPTDE